jgi:hypothetical protein
MTVPAQYPDESVKIKIRGADQTYHDRVLDLLVKDAERLILQMSRGVPEEIALRKVDVTKLVSKLKKQGYRSEVITVDSRASMKQDTRLVHKLQDMRAIAATDKYTRKGLKLIAKHGLREIDAEKQALVDLNRQELEDANREARFGKYAKTIDGKALPMVMPCIRYLYQAGFQMISTRCQDCDKLVLPKTGRDFRKMKTKDHMLPLRASCRHWMHQECMNKHITTPPWDKVCKVCSKRITHKNWTTNKKHLQGAYHRKTEKRREMDEILDFLS